MRHLSGIQPSGVLHLGNYLGAIRDHVALQEKGDARYFIADYHALTTVRNRAQLLDNVRQTAVTYLACGLDPARSLLYRQSDVPEVCELTWLLLTVTPMAMLHNATSYKDRVEKGIPADAGLFTYPVLMAADILAQDATHVPVGKDQVQHVEMARDMAEKFNRTYGRDVFTVPEYSLGECPYVPGIDGAKMSKSYGNTIGLFDTPDQIRKSVAKIKTDSKAPAEPKVPEQCTIFRLYSLVSPPEQVSALAEQYRRGGLGYGDAKSLLGDRLIAVLGPLRERVAHWQTRSEDVEDVLLAGAERARATARSVLARARDACGLERGGAAS
ncbi:MAG TPA: tryptophan--tRNA ligase [Phycisphaerales bacterium]|nr:tryptophan--tRNA ligase [Phycisphaerales bacterium]